MNFEKAIAKFSCLLLNIEQCVFQKSHKSFLSGTKNRGINEVIFCGPSTLKE